MADPFLTGGDISLSAEIERLGGVYRVDGESCSAAEALRRRGCNLARLRLFTRDPAWDGLSDRYNHLNDLDYTLDLAGQVKAAGLRLLLDFHYSDTWADPQKQHIPALWRDQSLAQLEQSVYDYTCATLAAFSAAGVAPDMVQVGNEVTNGLLWPLARIDVEQGCGPAARLLSAGLAAVRDSGAAATMIHIDRGGDRDGTARFCDGVFAAGVSCDWLGQSYYPFWHGTVSDLSACLNATAERYGLPLMVVETAMPWCGERPEGKLLPWPSTPRGQDAFLSALLERVHAVPDGLGRGVCWWGTEYLPVDNLPTRTWSQRSLFGDGGEATPALATLGAAAGSMEAVQ